MHCGRRLFSFGRLHHGSAGVLVRQEAVLERCRRSDSGPSSRGLICPPKSKNKSRSFERLCIIKLAIEIQLPDQLQRKLQLTVRTRRAVDGVEITKITPARIYERIGHGKQRMVEEIEGFKSKLQAQALRERCSLQRAEVQAHVFRPSQNATVCVPEDFSVRWYCHGGSIPPV